MVAWLVYLSNLLRPASLPLLSFADMAAVTGSIRDSQATGFDPTAPSIIDSIVDAISAADADWDKHKPRWSKRKQSSLQNQA